MEKELMKISDVKVGFGGYQDAMLGIWFSFSTKSSGVSDVRHGFWHTEWSSNCKWTEESRIKYFGELMMKIGKWLDEAKVDRVEKLIGIPVEVTFESSFGPLKEWRILTEVL